MTSSTLPARPLRGHLQHERVDLAALDRALEFEDAGGGILPEGRLTGEEDDVDATVTGRNRHGGVEGEVHFRIVLQPGAPQLPELPLHGAGDAVLGDEHAALRLVEQHGGAGVARRRDAVQHEIVDDDAWGLAGRNGEGVQDLAG